MSNLFFTSDLHFGHENIIKYCKRPYDSVESMNEGLISNWNEVVGPKDQVVVLGDVAMGRWKDNLRLVTRCNGRKFLVPGNHDRCWGQHKKPQLKEFVDAGFIVLLDQIPFPLYPDPDKLSIYWVDLCHLPYEEDSRHGDKFAGMHPKDAGRWLLHGHVHDTWKVKDRQINVGVDVWDYKPVAEEQIMEIINGGK